MRQEPRAFRSGAGGRETLNFIPTYLMLCISHHVGLRRGEARQGGGEDVSLGSFALVRVSDVLGSYVCICILRCMEKESCASLLTEILVRCIVQKKGGVRGMWLGSRWWVFSKIHEGISSTEGKGAWSRIRF